MVLTRGIKKQIQTILNQTLTRQPETEFNLIIDDCVTSIIKSDQTKVYPICFNVSPTQIKEIWEYTESLIFHYRHGCVGTNVDRHIPHIPKVSSNIYLSVITN